MFLFVGGFFLGGWGVCLYDRERRVERGRERIEERKKKLCLQVLVTIKVILFVSITITDILLVLITITDILFFVYYDHGYSCHVEPIEL